MSTYNNGTVITGLTVTTTKATAVTIAPADFGSTVLTFSSVPADFTVGAALFGTNVPIGSTIISSTSTTITISSSVVTKIPTGTTITAVSAKLDNGSGLLPSTNYSIYSSTYISKASTVQFRTGLTVPASSGDYLITLSNSNVTAGSETCTITSITSLQVSTLALGTVTNLTDKYSYDLSSKLSGIEIEQNLYNANISTSNPSATQEFKFADNFIRTNKYIPSITGFQIFANGVDGVGQLKYFLDRYEDNYGWINLRSGTVTMSGEMENSEAELSEDEWVSIRFSPVALDETWLNNKFRFRIQGNSDVKNIYYQNPNPFNNGVTKAKAYNGVNSFLSSVTGLNVSTTSGSTSATLSAVTNLLSNTVYQISSSTIPALNNITFTTGSTPSTSITLSSSSGVTTSGSPVSATITPTDSSLAFRILTLSADSGEDFFGNYYRSTVSNANVHNVLNREESYWLSKPNPSKFAIENLYFDLSENNKSVSIDSIYLDPITPNVYFNVYYSNDDKPGTTDSEWENLMWTPIPRTFKATKAQSYAFPENVTAKYIKVEFSHLQGRHYAPGAWQKPILYKKFPQWVFDYFIAAFEIKNKKTYDAIIKGVTTLEFDALALAFDYYKGDIIQTGNGIIEIKDPETSDQVLKNLLNNNDANSGSMSAALDSNTLNRIKTLFNKFVSHPSISADTTTLTGQTASNNANSTLGAGISNGRIAPAQNYGLETVTAAQANTSTVSSFDRESLLFEKNFPVMFFYQICKHGYREAYAKFENDKAYFVGVRYISFNRDNHLIRNDDKLYAYGYGESAVNLEHNDFTLSADNNTWMAK